MPQVSHIFFANRALPPEDRLREVYMDESYIHEHYHRNDDSIWDPTDEQDVQQSKDCHKGRRYCFACAIQGSNPQVALEDNVHEPTLVPGLVWAFCPQKTTPPEQLSQSFQLCCLVA